MIGRQLAAADGPKYLGLPGSKPFMGWRTATQSHLVYLTEGVFDWLLLYQWGYPAAALLGTHVRAAQLRALERFERVYLLLDGDEPGRAATGRLAAALGKRAVPIVLPGGAKDVADLALIPGGRDALTRAVGTQERAA